MFGADYLSPSCSVSMERNIHSQSNLPDLITDQLQLAFTSIGHCVSTVEQMNNLTYRCVKQPLGAFPNLTSLNKQISLLTWFNDFFLSFFFFLQVRRFLPGPCPIFIRDKYVSVTIRKSLFRALTTPAVSQRKYTYTCTCYALLRYKASEADKCIHLDTYVRVKF